MTSDRPPTLRDRIFSAINGVNSHQSALNATDAVMSEVRAAVDDEVLAEREAWQAQFAKLGDGSPTDQMYPRHVSLWVEKVCSDTRRDTSQMWRGWLCKQGFDVGEGPGDE